MIDKLKDDAIKNEELFDCLNSKNFNIVGLSIYNTTLQVFNKKISYRTFQCIISLRQQLQRKVIPYDKLIIQQRKPDW